MRLQVTCPAGLPQRSGDTPCASRVRRASRGIGSVFLEPSPVVATPRNDVRIMCPSFRMDARAA